MEDSTPADVKSARLSRLQKRIEEQAQVISQSMVGSVQRVLIEGTSKEGCSTNWPAAPTTTASSISSAIRRLINTFVDVRITAACRTA
jgi:tRNA-2-methylthio-N6-dimethylallyladenosine synthase